MKKSNAFSILEVSLIFMFVAVTSYFGWQAFTNKSFDLLNLSAVHQNTAGEVNNFGSLLSGLKSKFAEMLAYLKDNKASQAGSEAYNSKRVETTGVIGQMIAAYKNALNQGKLSIADGIKEAALDALKNLMLSDQSGNGTPPTGPEETDNSTAKAEACIADPSSCTTMMTVTTLSATLVGANPLSTYGGSKIPLKLNYTYSYVDDNGVVQTQNITQGVYIQKEQNASNVGKTYAQFLPEYIANKLNSTVATGDVTSIQQLMDAYTTGTNCELSKKDGQYYDFSAHKMYVSKNEYCYANPNQCN